MCFCVVLKTKMCYAMFSRKVRLWGGMLTPKRSMGHVPVMLNEVLKSLNLLEGQIILDMTFGGGGHTTAILDKFKANKVIALDRDPLAHSIANTLKDKYGDRIIPIHGKFSELGSLLPEHGIEKGMIDGVVLDAGCSSMQFDEAERGFSIMRDGPLDMRMNNHGSDSVTAADIVNSLNAEELQSIFSNYGEEQFSKTIATGIVRHRNLNGPIKTTHGLVNAIESSFDKEIRRKDKLNRSTHLATKAFMALRIFINDEFRELADGLQIVQQYIRSGGKIAVITFHSSEDRVVKRVLTGIEMQKPKNMTLKQKVRGGHKAITLDTNWVNLGSVKTPEHTEIKNNPRSRSAKLRVATRK